MGEGADHDLNQTDSAGSVAADRFLKRQLGLRDLVLAQVLTVVGSSWVGIAAGVGQAQFLIWLLAFVFFYAPMAIATYYLNREMPLEGGLYEWTRRSFGDGVGFMTAWNIWAYALSSIATILFQIPSEMAYMIGPAAAGLPENRMFVDLRLSVSAGQPVVHRVRVDTGSSDAVSDDLVRESPERRKSRQGVGLGQPYIDYSGVLDRVEIGPYVIRHSWGASNSKPAMGMEILRRFTTTFDAARGVLYLEPNSHLADPVPEPAAASTP